MTKNTSKGSGQRGRGRSVRRQKGAMLPLFMGLGLVGIVGAVLALVVFLRPPSDEEVALEDFEPKVQPQAEVGQTPEGFWYKGDPNAPVKVIGYADYECPACYTMEQSLEENAFDQQYIETGKVQFIFHDLPLTSIHPLAQYSAEVARCGGDQGKFWPVHDAIFATQKIWDQGAPNGADSIMIAAEKAGADRGQLEACVEAGTHTQAVTAAMNQAFAEGHTSTPTVLVNGFPVVYTGDWFTSLSTAIDAELAKTDS